MSKWSNGEAAGMPLWRRLAWRPELMDRRQALLKGLAWLIVATLLSWYFRVAPTSTIAFDVAGYVALWKCLAEQLMLWGVTAVMLYLVAALAGSECKFMELASRVLYARLPIYLLMLPATVGGFRVEYAVVVNDPMQAFSEYPVTIAYAVFAMAMVALYLWWSYRAFAKVRGREDMRGGVFFFVGIVLAYELSQWLMTLLG